MNTSLVIQENYSRKELKREAAKLTKGIENPIQAWSKLCRFEDLAKYAKAEIKEQVQQVVRDMEDNEQDAIHDGVLVKLEAGRTTWDFSHCQEWVELKERIKEIEGNMKKVAQSVGTTIINSETGEEYQAAKRNIGSPFLKSSY